MGLNEAVKVKRNGGILEVTLDRPKANAIDMRTSIAMGKVFVAFRDDPELRVAILTGGGENHRGTPCPRGWSRSAGSR